MMRNINKLDCKTGHWLKFEKVSHHFLIFEQYFFKNKKYTVFL